MPKLQWPYPGQVGNTQKLTSAMIEAQRIVIVVTVANAQDHKRAVTSAEEPASAPCFCNWMLEGGIRQESLQPYKRIVNHFSEFRVGAVTGNF